MSEFIRVSAQVADASSTCLKSFGDMPVPLPSSWSSRALRWLPFSLASWGVGVQVSELLATIGAWSTGVLALAVAWPVSLRRRWWPLVGFLAWSLVVPLAFGYPPTATGVARLADFLLLGAAAVAVARLEVRWLERIGLAVALTLVISSAVAGLQHVGFWPRAETVAAWPWHPVGYLRVYETVPGRDDRFMAGGLLLHRLKFANVTAVMCVLGTAAVAARRPWWRAWGLATAVGLVGLAVFPHARAALVAGVVAVGVTWTLGSAHRGRALLGALGLGALVLLVALLVPSVRARFETSFTNEGSGERASLTEAGLNAVHSAPWTGVGPGRFRPGLFLNENAPQQAREHVGKAHDQFVTIAAECGLPAAVLLVLTLVVWVVLAFRARPSGAALMGGVVLFALLGLLHDPLFHAEVSLALVLMLGAGLGILSRQPEATT